MLAGVSCIEEEIWQLLNCFQSERKNYGVKFLTYMYMRKYRNLCAFKLCTLFETLLGKIDTITKLAALTSLYTKLYVKNMEFLLSKNMLEAMKMQFLIIF